MREIKSPIPDENRSKDSLLKELEDLRQREGHLRAVIDTCPVPLFLKDTEGRYLLANKEYQKWYNQKESDILGGSLDLVLSPERAKVARERDLLVLNSGESNAKELDWTFPDGVTRQTIGVKFPVYAEDGEPIGVGGVRTDVTALRSVEAELEKAHRDLEQRVEDRTRELRDSENRFRDFAEGATDSFWEMDANLTFSSATLMLNPVHSTIHKLKGKTRWETVGTDADNDPNWIAHRQDMEAHRPFRNFEYQVMDATGTARRLSISGSPIFDDNNAFKGYRGTATDISERVVAEERALTARNQLTEAIEALSEGFVFFDADERFVICNSRYRELYAPTSDMLEPGVRYEDWVRTFAVSGRDLDAIGREEEWVQQRLQQFRNPAEPKDSRLDDGRHIRTIEYRTASGGSAGLRADVTESRRLEAALRESEAQYRAILDNMIDTYYRADNEGRVIATSPSVTGLLGYSIEELIGKPLASLYLHEEDRAAFLVAIQKSGGSVSNYEAPLKRKDGTVVWVSTSAHYVLDNAGNVVGVEGNTRDITARKQAEHALRESESLLRSIIDNAPAQVNLKGRDERYMLVNEAFARARNVAPEEIVGTYSEKLSIPDHASSATSQHRRVIESGKTIIEERKTFSRNGKPYHALITKFPVFDTEGNITSVGTFSTDIRALKEAEEAVRAALEEARNADKAKQDFLANMSHELRTPLNAIMGFSEVMQMEYFGPLNNARYLDYVNDISQSAKHLLELVNDILDLSKIEAGKLELSFADVDLATVAAAAVRELQDQMRQKSQHFSMDINRDAAAIHADGSAVRQMLTNLLSNAVKFTPEHGAITLSVGSVGSDAVKITVSDSGVGIPEADIKKVLSPFGQSGDIKLAREGGTGLGLPIVGALVKLHGGALEIDSVVGTGTQVHIMLPKVAAPANPP